MSNKDIPVNPELAELRLMSIEAQIHNLQKLVLALLQRLPPGEVAEILDRLLDETMESMIENIKRRQPL